MSFDPYYEWLGIPPDEQPPDRYRLLGIRRFESNLTVIENAAERQTLLLKSRQNGPHGVLTQRLMNEVSAARFGLLDVQTKAQYDLGLRRDHINEVSSPPDIAAPPVDLQQLKEPEPDWIEFHGPTKPLPCKNAQPSPQASRLRGRNTPSSPRRPKVNLGLPLACGGIAAVSILMIWVWLSGTPGRTPTQAVEHPVESRHDLANAAQKVHHRRAPAPPPQPPPLVPVDRTSSSEKQTQGPSGDSASLYDTLAPSNPSVTGANALGSIGGPVPDVDADTTQRGDRPPRSVETSIAASNSRDSTQANDTTRLRNPRDKAKSTPNSRPVPTTYDSSTPGVVTGLRADIDLREEIASSDAGRIVLGNVPASIAGRLRIGLEDHSSATEKSQFSIYETTSAGDLRKWTLRYSPTTDQSYVDGVESSTEHAHEIAVAIIELDRTQMLLQFTDSVSETVITRMGVCCLHIHYDTDLHTIQFRGPKLSPPLAVRFDASKDSSAIGQLLPASLIPPERITLEVLGLEIANTAVPSVAGRQVQCGEELTLELDDSLPCELGVRLIEKDGEFSIVTVPRYTLANRRQRLVAAEVEKEVTRTKVQLTKNDRDLRDAQARYNSLPGQIQRVNTAVPATLQEATLQQSQLRQLEQLGRNLESRVRRLSGLKSNLANTLDVLTRVSAFVSRISEKVHLHVRVCVHGEHKDLILYVASAENDTRLRSAPPVRGAALRNHDDRRTRRPGR